MTRPRPDRNDLLLHMTGLDRSPEPTRNHFCAEASSAEYTELLGMTVDGLVSGPFTRESIFPGQAFFYATEAGLKAARRAREEAPPCT